MNKDIEEIRMELNELIKNKADYNLILEKSKEFDEYMNKKNRHSIK